MKSTSISDFFNKMPCIVDMNTAYPSKKKIDDNDKIVRVELIKETYPYYTVYYFHRIFNDDRIYKCSLRMNALPDAIKAWCERHCPIDNKRRTMWQGDEISGQLTFNI